MRSPHVPATAVSDVVELDVVAAGSVGVGLAATVGSSGPIASVRPMPRLDAR
jgi:hypothetical protein